ncbi:MAG: protein translocase subunit SecF [Gammaproteobacteria bacterium]|jgi:preprotein translocase subunit SecF|nr:protein translocase subunit SecF [Chromatiales bacterium]MDP6673536.1 protein translocase subunit SecF [Gammaproteobacteria bacterium]
MQIISTTTNINFMDKRRITAVLSAVLILVGIISLFSRGLNLGIDFTGGVLLEVGYSAPADLGDIRSRLESGNFANASVQNFGTATDVLIRVLPEESVESAQVGDQILSLLTAGDTSVELRRAEFVGPQVGKELTERGGLAMLFAVIMILIYIMIRFQWKFAVGSVAALVHDVIITISIFSIFQFPFDLSVLAAILAVIGYSLNDTIVVFDRIRENFRLIRQQGAEAIMNTSINQMLGRTIITSLTTLFVLLALLLLGGEAVRGFALALIIGILVGTYSSIYTASASALALDVTTEDLMPKKVDKEAVDDLP